MNIEKIKKLRVLYVEDEIALRDITCGSLGTVVSNIVVASNGQEGLDKFNSDDFDIVITDIAMPVMDGMEMIKNIRSIDKQIPILMTTAFSSENTELSEIINGEHISYVMKPVNVMQLVEAMDKLTSDSQ